MGFYWKIEGKCFQNSGYNVTSGNTMPSFYFKADFFFFLMQRHQVWTDRVHKLLQNRCFFVNSGLLFPSSLLLQLICIQSDGSSDQANYLGEAIYETRNNLQSNFTSSLLLFIFPSWTDAIITQPGPGINIDQNSNTTKLLFGMASVHLLLSNFPYANMNSPLISFFFIFFIFF